MLFKYFRGAGPGVVAAIVFLAVALWWQSIAQPPATTSFIYEMKPMPLYSLLLYINDWNPVAGVLFTVLILLVVSFQLVSFNTSWLFINERTFLPAVIFIIFSGFFPAFQSMNPVLPSAILLLIAIRRIMDAYRKSDTAYNFFDAAFIIGTGSLFYANLIWFSLLPFIGIALLRTGNIKELFLSVVGFLTPFFLITAIYYLMGKDLELLLSDIHYNLFGRAGNYFFSKVTIVGLMIVGIASFASLVYLFSVMGTKKIRSRKTFSVLTWMLVISLAIVLFIPSASLETVYLTAIPLSYFLTHYLLLIRKKVIAEIVFSVILLCVILIQVFNSL